MGTKKALGLSGQGNVVCFPGSRVTGCKSQLVPRSKAVVDSDTAKQSLVFLESAH